MQTSDGGDLPGRRAVVDASVWVAIFVPVDVHHLASRRWLESYVNRGNRIVAPQFLRVELAGAVARRIGDSERAERVVSSVREDPSVEWLAFSDDLFERAAQLAARLRLRGGDAVYVAAAEAVGARLVSWDFELLARARSVVNAAVPDA